MYQACIAITGNTIRRGEFALPESLESSIHIGIESFWTELQPALLKLQNDFQWDWLGRVATHACDTDSPHAMPGNAINVLNIVENVMALQALIECTVYVLFVSDWPEDGQVRYGEGAIGDLRGYFNLFGGWDQLYYKLPTKHVQQGDWLPFLVKVTRDQRGAGG